MTNDFAKHYLENAIAEFRAMKRLGEWVLEQLVQRHPATYLTHQRS